MTRHLETDRLVLRPWDRPGDLGAMAAISADPVVMEHFPATNSLAETEAFVARQRAAHQRGEPALWAVEVRATGDVVGFVGLAVPRFEADFTPCVEVGWRLARRAWGHGYATEAATAAITDGFTRLGLDEVVSFTAAVNERSRAVMRRLGMTPDGEFDHPSLGPGSPLRRHVLFRLPRPDGSTLAP